MKKCCAFNFLSWNNADRSATTKYLASTIAIKMPPIFIPFTKASLLAEVKETLWATLLNSKIFTAAAVHITP